MIKMKVKNPVLKGFNPDPCIIRANDRYYIATSTFEYFPGINIYESKDLVNWKLIAHPLGKDEINMHKKVSKEEMIYRIKEKDYTINELKILLKQDNLLQEGYDEWLDSDGGFNQVGVRRFC